VFGAEVVSQERGGLAVGCLGGRLSGLQAGFVEKAVRLTDTVDRLALRLHCLHGRLLLRLPHMEEVLFLQVLLQLLLSLPQALLVVLVLLLLMQQLLLAQLVDMLGRWLLREMQRIRFVEEGLLLQRL